ncbi:MAG: glycosyltransferase family 1 protein [Desulfobacterales bacterium]|nr:glycosyltransferase family 1 protein [Desulfobacterales bacterium]
MKQPIIHNSRFDTLVVNAGPLKNIATGIGRYIRELYRQIQVRYPELVIRYFDGIRLCEQMPVPPGGRSPWTAAVDLAWRLPPGFVYMARMLAHEMSARRFYRVSRGFDIYHEAGYFPYKAAGNVKTVFTIHDLSLKIMPQFHPKDRVRFFNKYFEKSLNLADAIITPSAFTGKEFQKTYPDMPARIHPIPLGCDKSLFYDYPREKINAFKAQKRLPEKYVLFAGTSDPRKNIRAVFDALAHLPAHVKLVCTGWSGWGKDGQGSRHASGLKDRIIYTGYVSDAELALLYAGARVFVYPSFYEGFGLPVLEAMACGCPVVCADTASLPEVAGDAAILCDPDDSICLADAIQRVFDSDELYSRMRRQGLKRAAGFDWSKTAGKTVEVFEYVCVQT